MILVADDYSAIANLIKLALESAGYQATIVDRGDVAYLRSMKHPYQLLIFDEDMPGMSGSEVLQLVRGQSGPNQATPAILCSANLPAVRSSGDSLHLFDSVLQKPFSPVALLQLAGDLLSPQGVA